MPKSTQYSLLSGFQLWKIFFQPFFLRFFFLLFDNQMLLLVSCNPVLQKLDVKILIDPQRLLAAATLFILVKKGIYPHKQRWMFIALASILLNQSISWNTGRLVSDFLFANNMKSWNHVFTYPAFLPFFLTFPIPCASLSLTPLFLTFN